MAEPARIPMVECHGGPLDGYITRWPMMDGEPSPSVEFQYAACDAEGQVEVGPEDYLNVTYLYVDRAKAVWRGLRPVD